MAYQVGSACYDTVDLARSALAAAEVGKVVPAGGTAYVVDASATASGVRYSLSDALTGAAAIVYETVPSIPECSMLGASDALVMGWGVAAAWLCAYALLAMRKAL